MPLKRTYDSFHRHSTLRHHQQRHDETVADLQCHEQDLNLAYDVPVVDHDFYLFYFFVSSVSSLGNPAVVVAFRLDPILHDDDYDDDDAAARPPEVSVIHTAAAAAIVVAYYIY